MILGFALFGADLSCRLRERLKRLKIIRQSLIIFESQIDFALMSIPDCFEKIGHSFNEKYIVDFYLEISNKLKMDGYYSFSNEWRKGVEKYLKENYLTVKDCEMIEEIGEMPLYLNKSVQILIIHSTINQMGELIHTLDREINYKCRVYKISGISFGVLCILLLV